MRRVTRPGPRGSGGPGKTSPNVGTRPLARVAQKDALRARLVPAEHRIEVEDILTLPEELRATPGGLRLRLHADLELSSDAAGLRLVPGDVIRGNGAAPVRQYVLEGDGPLPEKVTLHYAGVIHHPVMQGRESARSFSQSPGIIDERGAVLSESSAWFPQVPGALVAFELTVDLPAGWDVVSQGERTTDRTDGERRTVTWNASEPSDTIYLIAARFSTYDRQAGNVLAQVFLREPDPNLAARYLEVTAQYVGMYEGLIGPYPYKKFALVENFWETGYGMPSFTLLGSQVIRLPFILHSSYPHEILHNWWGNSVFVDYEGGNWCEGLTAYLADHLVSEGQGQGVQYRRDALKKYRNFVRGARDFPLSSFHERHSEATEAVGYGKCLMVWHMLRRQLGDESFTRGLQSLYRQYRFRRASWSDIEQVFSGIAGEDLGPFFAQWIGRTGAPDLELGEVAVTSAEQGFEVQVGLRQLQEEDAFALQVPVAFTLEDGRREIRTVSMEEPESAATVLLPGRPVRVEVDPEFDMFRRLHRQEIPPTLGQVFGAERRTLVLPTDDREAWRELAAAWSGEGVQVVGEEELSGIPADRAVWVLGSGNRWARALEPELETVGATLAEGEIRFGPSRVSRDDHAFVCVVSHPGNPDLALGWVGAANLAAVPGLARKLPHYGKYSYLAFRGTEPTNVVKGQWEPSGSPLRRDLGDIGAPPAEPSARQPLSRLAPVFDPGAFSAHVQRLAAPEMEGRGVGTAGLDRAADDVAACFEKAGLAPAGDDGTWFQTWSEPGGPDGQPVTLRNVVGVLRGKQATWDTQSVVIGAHYDHLGHGWPDARTGNEGQVHPGADDNASGVAVLIEVAGLLAATLEPDRNLVFVAFSGEEWGLKGSRHYVSHAGAWPVSEALAMINLDTVGRLGRKPITLLGTGSASEWPHIARGVGFTTGVEARCVDDDLGSSDQRSFLDAGVPAIQVFTGGHEDYHRPSDTADKVDAAGMVKVATFVRETLAYLAGREQPLSSSLKPGQAETPAAAGARRVSLGTLPDFAYPGPGVRIERVLENTPAAQAGIKPGDLVLAIDGQAVADLRAYSDLLKARKPGDTIVIRLKRDDQELTVEAKLVAR